MTTLAKKSSILSLNHNNSESSEIEETRHQALLRVTPDTIHKLEKCQLVSMQKILQHGEVFGFWKTPRKWDLTQNGEKALNVDLRHCINRLIPTIYEKLVHDTEKLSKIEIKNGIFHAIKSELAICIDIDKIMEISLILISRYLILLRIGPSGLGKRGRGLSLGVRNIKSIAYGILPSLIALAICKWISKIYLNFNIIEINDKNLLSILNFEDLDILSENLKKKIFLEIRRMQLLYDLGCWIDIPFFGSSVNKTTNISGKYIDQKEQKFIDTHLPLPDDYVSEMGKRSLWIINNLAPPLLEIAKKFLSIWTNTNIDSASPQSIINSRKNQVNDYLKNYIWLDKEKNNIDKLPFFLRLCQSGRSSVENKLWPPKSQGQIMGLLHTIQMAHYFVVALSTGARGPSELLNLKSSCIRYTPTGTPYLNGRTFKLVKMHDGELRDWVLPDLAVKCIEQQSLLASLTKDIGPLNPAFQTRTKNSHSGELNFPKDDYLWTHIASHTRKISHINLPLRNINSCLRNYARDLGLSTTPGGQNFRSHRFRKTVARLVSLALTQAPKILKDVFGHTSIEMTLYYILSNKDLRSEIEIVSRELRIMRAKEVIENMIADEDKNAGGKNLTNYGGHAALKIHNAIRAHERQLHSRGEKWGASTVIELAEILTLQGKAWQYVRSGIICTKFAGTESGPCNQSLGHPEPARCDTSCSHRLEEAFLREDVDGAIADAVQFYQNCKSQCDDLGQSFWAAQIRTHLLRFTDIYEKWKINFTVKEIINFPN